MSVTVSRTMGVLALLWALRNGLWMSPQAWSSTAAYGASLVGFVVAGAWLMAARRIEVGGGVLLIACVVELLARPAVDNTPVILLAWVAAILLVTPDEPAERALLLRVCATVVYTFAALSKINPSWLRGEGIARVDLIRDHLGPAAVVALAVLVIASELAVAGGLWVVGTRRLAVVLGVLLHVGIVATVSRNVRDVLFLGVLNGGLVGLYPAFWAPVSHGSSR